MEKVSAPNENENIYEAQQEKKAHRRVASTDNIPTRVKAEATKEAAKISAEHVGFIKAAGGLTEANVAWQALGGKPKGGEKPPEADLERIKKDNDVFLKETFAAWGYDKNQINIEQKPALVAPKNEDYEQHRNDTDPSKFGEYTVNPEMAGLNFENIPPEKIKILDLADFQGKPLSEVAKHIVSQYGDTHYIPDISFWKWMLESLDNAPADVQQKYTKLKDGNYYFCLGSLVRASRGYWRFPYADWFGSKWNRNADWLDEDWYSDFRVVLLEK